MNELKFLGKPAPSIARPWKDGTLIGALTYRANHLEGGYKEATELLVAHWWQLPISTIKVFQEWFITEQKGQEIKTQATGMVVWDYWKNEFVAFLLRRTIGEK